MFIASFSSSSAWGPCHLYIPLLASFGLTAQLLLFIILRTQTQIRGSSKQKQPFIGRTKRGNGERSNGGKKLEIITNEGGSTAECQKPKHNPPQTLRNLTTAPPLAHLVLGVVSKTHVETSAQRSRSQ